jgi:superfamily II DNA/RNA helicase
MKFTMLRIILLFLCCNCNIETVNSLAADGSTQRRFQKPGSSTSSPSKNSKNGRPNNNKSSRPGPPQQRQGQRPPSTGTTRNEFAYARRSKGIKTKSSGPKPPKWEKEGDALYLQSVSTSTTVSSATEKAPSNSDTPRITWEQAEIMLAQLERPPVVELEKMTHPNVPKEAATVTTRDEEEVDEPATEVEVDEAPTTSFNLWGTLPVGPILKRRLVDASLATPTPVQTAAFTALTAKTTLDSKTRQNAIIASPTGSGKSLAYLLPLLANPPGGKRLPCMAMIVTPTVELAFQLQREVNRLWPNENSENNGDSAAKSKSLLHVVDDSSEMQLLAQVGDSPILAGTPRSLRSLMKEMKVLDSPVQKAAAFASPKNKGKQQQVSLDDLVGEMKEAMHQQDDKTILAKATSLTIRTNLQVIVLDEADRLLKTEGVARAAAQLKERTGGTRVKIQPMATTQTESLLRELPTPLERLQLICASATVGRTLRRQLMELLQAPSMDKAAVLVTADVRTGKNADKRKASLLPETLTHTYKLLPSPASHTKKATPEQQQVAAEQQETETIQAVWDTLQSLAPAPTLIFPGRIGVDRVQQALKEKFGLQDIRLLSNAMGLSPSSSSSSSLLDETQTNISWQDTPVTIVGDKFGRGLDLPGIRNVVLLSVPSSAAGYTHLSGRTGRNGQEGTAITFVRPREAPKLVGIAQALGLSFGSINGNTTLKSDDSAMTTIPREDSVGTEQDKKKSTKDYIWNGLSESSLQRKTIAELTDYLENSGGVLLADFFSGKKPKKADLIAAIHVLHENL